MISLFLHPILHLACLQVPFTEVLDLVKGRKVYLEKRLAYITKEDLGTVVSTKFRQNLSYQLAVRARTHGRKDTSF